MKIRKRDSDVPRNHGERIPTWRTWPRVVVQSARDMWSIGIVETAVALSFYAMLCHFPLMFVGIVIASHAADPEWEEQ